MVTAGFRPARADQNARPVTSNRLSLLREPNSYGNGADSVFDHDDFWMESTLKIEDGSL